MTTLFPCRTQPTKVSFSGAGIEGRDFHLIRYLAPAPCSLCVQGSEPERGDRTAGGDYQNVLCESQAGIRGLRVGAPRLRHTNLPAIRHENSEEEHAIWGAT